MNIYSLSKRLAFKTSLLISATLVCLTACNHVAYSQDVDKELAYKFRGDYGVILVLSSLTRHEYVTITNEKERYIASPSLLAKKGGGVLDYNNSKGLPVPKTIHVKWRSPKDGKAIWGKGGGIDYEGTVIGNYTVPVAERIPDTLLDDLRRNGKGNLRIKIRLSDDGVLIGWDIERKGFRECTSAEYEMAGGDFREAERCNGKVVRKGWYIDKNGQKIETDY